ncbi:MAG: FAD:protein FMN transferase [Planctomycetota bacterium]
MSANTDAKTVLNRRQVLRIVAVGGAGAAIWKFGWPRGSDARPVTESRVLMGTQVNLTVLGPDREAARAAVGATLDRMAELESRLTRYRDDSEVGLLNATGAVEGASDDLLSLLSLGRDLHARSEGAFDMTVQPLVDLYRSTLAQHNRLPTDEEIAAARTRVGDDALRVDGRRVSFAKPGMALTLDGIGKGYIVDHAVEELKSHGFGNVLVEAGGDLVAAGAKAENRPWRLGIRRPRAAMSNMLRIDASDRAVATSGDYLQPFTPDYTLHHILDPRTGVSAPELASSTVVAPNAALADGLATLTMVLGAERSVTMLAKMDGCEGCFIGKDLAITRTAGFRTV